MMVLVRAECDGLTVKKRDLTGEEMVTEARVGQLKADVFPWISGK